MRWTRGYSLSKEKYHCSGDLFLFYYFIFNCFANVELPNNRLTCLVEFQPICQTGGQPWRDISPYEVCKLSLDEHNMSCWEEDDESGEPLKDCKKVKTAVSLIAHFSSWCYKTFFGWNLENLDFPLSPNSNNRPF